MLITCWSVKGGSGTTVVASSLALLSAQYGADTCLVDLAGDSPASLGIPEPTGPGIGHWLAATPQLPADALRHLEVPVADGLTCLPFGEPPTSPLTGSSACSPNVRSACLPQLLEYFAEEDRTFVVDGGSTGLHQDLRRVASHDLLVIRGCYLALRRAARLPYRPDGVVLISEPGRVLRSTEVCATVGAPVVADIPWDPTVSRSIDSGLLAGSLPRALRDALSELAWL